MTDYTICLSKALQGLNTKACVSFLKGWNWAELKSIPASTSDTALQVVHVQYPSLEMGKSPLVGLVPVLYRHSSVFITLHEFDVFSVVRKLCMLPYSVMAKGIIFTNEKEKQNFCRLYPWSLQKCSIVPVGTNIAPPEDPRPAENGIVYFGQIADGKGLEEYLDTVALMRAKGSTEKCSVIGAIVDEKLPICRRLYEAATRHDIRLDLNLSAGDVSAKLLEHRVAVLPFPDGVSDKRGSAMACLQHGLRLLTTHAATTPRWLAEGTTRFESPEAACDMLMGPRQGLRPERPEVLARELKRRTWPSIAEAHVRLYREALTQARPGSAPARSEPGPLDTGRDEARRR